MSGVDYGLLALVSFFGSFVGAVAKDFYDFLKRWFRRVHAVVAK